MKSTIQRAGGTHLDVAADVVCLLVDPEATLDAWDAKKEGFLETYKALTIGNKKVSLLHSSNYMYICIYL